jgi:dienelactone hydrolase
VETRVPTWPSGVVVVLHGGAGRRAATPVSSTQLSVLRMVPIAARIAREGKGRLAVFRLLNSARGWDPDRTPVDDVRWALEQLRSRLASELPFCLVGHSLGGRAALLAAGAPAVASAVALAPWVYDTDGDVPVSGRRILIVHGTRDRIASPTRSAAVGRALSRTNRVGYLSVEGGNHSMLGRLARFDRFAADFARATLLGDDVQGPVGRILDGEQRIEV